MKQPNRDHLEWSSFTSRFAALLTWLPMLCFWVVVGGSVYGIQKSIESQHPGAGLLIALAAAIVIQTLNRVSVHFSTRWIASWFVGREQLRANTHQKVKIVDGAVGLACLLFTGSICYFDFRANREASEKAAQNLVSAPDTIRVDANANAPAIHAAQLAVEAARQAEQAERAAFEAGVDKQINAQRGRYAQRQTRLQNLSPRPAWAANELKQINATLKNLEAQRRQRKAEFTPRKSNLAQAQTDLAAVSGEASRQLLANQTHADTTNIGRAIAYEAKKESYSMAMFWLYITAMLLWHLCHALKSYRALRYDETIPDAENPLIAIVETLKDGLENFLWGIKAKIMEWMPETEVHGITRTDLLEQTNTSISHDVFNLILQNAGINEMLIYTHFRGRHEPENVRKSLRLLKTAKLVFENNHIWTADAGQAKFFTAPPTPSPHGEGQGGASIFDPTTIAASF